MHSSGWDPKFDPRGKRLATIGNGASGIQITTEIRKVAEHVDVSSWLIDSHSTKANPRGGPCSITHDLAHGLPGRLLQEVQSARIPHCTSVRNRNKH